MSGKVATDKLAPRDFMPFADRQAAAPQSPEEQQMICRTVAAALGQGQAVRKPVRSINA